MAAFATILSSLATSFLLLILISPSKAALDSHHYDQIHSGGPSWNVLTGRKDLVASSGGHTLGFSHCSSFEASSTSKLQFSS
ncbi:hypothetical protein POTOM_042509 [Populus tomentosa]|uniref:Uncharacterized protein n=1 Tax=Populus tomentosa TaxID=118781 RepID=A0A8X7YQZ9_POPTO|nr:hypothetical protein POTOM_042509 [Populus tomentosa]